MEIPAPPQNLLRERHGQRFDSGDCPALRSPRRFVPSLLINLKAVAVKLIHAITAPGRAHP